MNQVLEKIGKLKLLPVIKIKDVEKAVPLAGALIKGGLPAAEITFRTSCAAEAIKRITEAYPDMLVGAGTVLSVEQVDAAVGAGAKFIVSPGLNPKVVGYCVENGIPVVPGVVTPGEIETALGFGLEVVKFFPAEAYGGVKTIKALSAPYGMIKFMPTGGINEDNIGTYLACPAVFACGGSFMVGDSLIAEGNFDKIADLTEKAMSIVSGRQ
ncbi:MAG: bifunctional 4-hydroxy-2-oxoglutarate aldolase/2-dehydro-3-deoxy-phosphogluconate aldolase [Clostridia bacterium]|nr:bifunctional 4-hydroxy-2-oxoglutarate aldolase/2-dehydro-3-deoxy-phosphogluconate aldolase [Clostridia bacterium]